MKKAVLIFRSLYGVLLVLVAADARWPFLPQHQMSEQGAALVRAVDDAGYLLPIALGIVVVGGLCLLAGYFSPLALAFLAPVVLNIFLFRLLLDPGGLALASVLLALQLFLMWGYRDYFEELLQIKPQVF